MSTNIQEVTVYKVLINEDLTEGRGRDVVHCVCALETTALRLAKGINTMGSDGKIEPAKVFKIDGSYYRLIHVTPPSDEDLNAKPALDKKKVLARLKYLLQPGELEILEK